MKDVYLDARAAANTLDEVLPETPLEAEKLAASIERAVQYQTSGGVRGLTVVVNHEGVLLMGRCQTYYCKQLAQQAAMGGIPSNRLLTNAIEVS